jgi:hypothetical protein
MLCGQNTGFSLLKMRSANILNPHCSSEDYIACELSTREKSTGKNRLPKTHMLKCLAISDHHDMILRLQLKLSGTQCSVAYIIEPSDVSYSYKIRNFHSI